MLDAIKPFLSGTFWHPGREPLRNPYRRRLVESRSDGPEFSGSYIVTSRNSLIHKGATKSTKSLRFGAEGLQHGLSLRAWRCVEEPFATVNFGEFLFFPDVG